MKKFMMIFAMIQMTIWSCVKPEIESSAIGSINSEDVVFTATTEDTKANPGKSFEKCAIFINIVPEIDPANENKTKRCLVNIDDVSMEVVE